MDPFSITVGAIGLAGAANKATGSVIKRLKALRNAPEELQDLLAELSQFEDIFQAIQDAADPSEITHSPLETLLDTAKDKILELHRLIEYRLTKAGTSSEVDRSQWAGSQKDVDRLRKQLINLRANLHVNLSINTNNTLEDTCRLLRQVNSNNHAMGQMAAALLPQILQEVQSTGSAVTSMLKNFPHLTLETSHSNLQSVPDTAHDSSLAQTDLQTACGRSSRRLQPGRTHESPHCRSSCQCKCHDTYFSSSPGLLAGFFGRIWVDRKGSSWVEPSRHIPSCKASAVSQTRVIYFVPTWFAMKVYVIRYTSSPLHAPEWLIKIPRLVSRDKNRGFQAIYNGDLPRFRSSIANGECTPYDVDEEGVSMLWLIVIHQRFDLMAHLVSIGVDLCQSVDANSRWLNQLWILFVESRDLLHNCGWLWMLDLLPSFPLDEFIENEGFTLLHEIVCDFNGQDLDRALQTHSADVNKVNKKGQSPLEMAVKLQNITAARTLLKRGADPNIHQGEPLRLALRYLPCSKKMQFLGTHTPHLLPESGCLVIVDLLLRSGATVRGPTGDKAAQMWIRLGKNNLNNAEGLAIDRLLVEYGIDVNSQVSGTTKVMALCQWHLWRSENFDRIQQLIDLGADLNLSDTQGYSALHCAVCAENPKAIKTLLHLGARIDVKTNEGNTIAHLAVICSRDIESAKVMSEMHLGRLDLDLKNEDGYTVFELLRKRNGLGWEAYYSEWRRRRVNGSGHKTWWFPRSSRAYGDEYALILALEALPHHIQDLQGVPKDQQYPPLGEYLSDDKDEDSVPGAWPV